MKVMAYCYASITGSSVLIFKEIRIPTGLGEAEAARYNPTLYEGEGGRGWCIFEQGVCTTVAAHLHAAEAQKELPPRFARAQARRAKVIDISADGSQPRAVTQAPTAVLDDATRMIERARFTGKADQAMVPHMLAVFEWTICSAVERATNDLVGSGATLDPALKRKTSVSVFMPPRRAPINPAGGDAPRSERPTSALVTREAESALESL